jgi:hypothetical protein
MTEYQLNNLLKMKERIISKVEGKQMKVQEGATLLGVTRQGFLKLRKCYREHGERALLGLKRGPKSWHRPWNRTDKNLEEFVIKFREDNPLDGPITISWQLADDHNIYLNHQTIYRIIKRAGLIKEQKNSKREWQEVATSSLENAYKLIHVFLGATAGLVSWKRWTYIVAGLMDSYLIVLQWRMQLNCKNVCRKSAI